MGIGDGSMQEIERLLEHEIRFGRLPGAVLAIGTKEGPMYEKSFGFAQVFPERRPMQTDTLFDLASLTKVVAALPAVMVLIERGKLGLDDAVCKYIPEFAGQGRSRITIRHLLTHTSGLPNSVKFYRYLTTREETIVELYRTELEYETGSKVVYSDLGFVMLGLLVEKVSGTAFDVFVRQEILEPLGMKHTCFKPDKGARCEAAATEFFREMGGYQCGEVHDRNAKVMGQVSGHAGLFSKVQDLIRYASLFLQDGVFDGFRLLKSETLREMARNQTIGLNAARGLGWVIYEPGDESFAGDFSEAGYGHTGFTGTSMYLNPRLDLYVIFLTNRIHYGRSDDIMWIRKQVHKRIAEMIKPAAF